MRNQAATYTVTNAGDPETDVRLGDIQTDWQKIPGKVRGIFSLAENERSFFFFFLKKQNVF